MFTLWACCSTNCLPDIDPTGSRRVRRQRSNERSAKKNPSSRARWSHELEEQTLADGTTTSITPEEISGARDSDPKQMHSCLLGDLDAIVMMALRKEPDRRYASVDDLSEDIRKHLEGLPITARPSTIAYRGAKFVRRHKELAVGALVFLVLLGGAWRLSGAGKSASQDRGGTRNCSQTAHRKCAREIR